jgi:hypothetical protein
MNHHRCTRCRNPIRSTVVEAPAPRGGHFHVDCWERVRHERQQAYESEIRSTGLAALIAPYVHATPRPVVVAAAIVEQATGNDLETGRAAEA